MDAFAFLALSATLVAGTNERLPGLQTYVAGDVRISNAAGTKIEGAIASIQDGKIELLTRGGTQTIPLDGVVKIERRGDSLKDGFIRGAIIGAVLAVAACTECDAGARIYVGSMAGLAYGVVGVGIDALHTGWTTVYERKLNAARTGSGVTFARVSFRF